MTDVGSWMLNFKLDNKGMALHSQVASWQKAGGYNDSYDEIFMGGTNNNVGREKFYFNDKNGKEFVLWIWRGDYINCGSGAEMGIYNRPFEIEKKGGSLEHWEVADYKTGTGDGNYTFPMTLNLYNYKSGGHKLTGRNYSERDYQHVFSWAPTAKQWWITGFNPLANDKNDLKVDKPNVKQMVMLGSIDFRGYDAKMFESLKKTYEKKTNFILFDPDEEIAWVTWWEKGAVS